jgi:hypothetical protein
MSLLDSGSSNCVVSPATARRWGYYVPEEPSGHGSMSMAYGTETPIYGWTGALRVYSPFHLLPSDGSARITALPPMNCPVADISEDVIVGYNYIEPLQGGFARDGVQRCFRFSISPAPGAPTVLVPLVGPPLPSTKHYAMKDGYAGTKFETFNTISSASASDGDPHRRLHGAKSQRKTAMRLLQYQQDFPQMVTRVDFRVQQHMTAHHYSRNRSPNRPRIHGATQPGREFWNDSRASSNRRTACHPSVS